MIKRSWFSPGFATFLTAMGLVRISAAEQRLFDLEQGFDLKRLSMQDATALNVKSAAALGLRIATGHKKPWPGVTLQAPSGRWDLSAFSHVAVNVKNIGTNKVTLSCRVDNPGADGARNCVAGSVTLNPGQTDTLRVALKRTSDDKLGGKLFGMRGYPVTTGGPGAVDARNITQLLLFVNKPNEDHEFEVGDIRAIGSYTPPTATINDAEPFLPFIDTFGQYKHKDWLGKTHSPAELAAKREAEAKELEANPGPKEWNKFGGWENGPHRKATGFFRVEKYRDKWWLVDPEGRLFWSHGIDCVRALDTTPIEERESWFEEFPGDRSEFREFLSQGHALKRHYAGWFQYKDEPTTGRVYDEENYQIGFADVTDTPYAETIAASREVAADLYRWRLE